MRLLERPPATPRRPGTYPWDWPARRRLTARLAGFLVGAGWRWRTEIGVLLVTVAVWSCLAAVTSRLAAAVLVVILLAAVLASTRVRARLRWIEHRARLRRRWRQACRHAGLETFNERVPRITRIARLAVGEALSVRLPAGQCVTDLEERGETLAAYLQVREV